MRKFVLVLTGLFLMLSGGLAKVESPWISTDKSYDSSSLDAIIKSVIKPGMTNDEKAIAIYNYCRLTFYHFAYPTEKDGIGPLKAVNVYGWSLCGGLHTVLGELYKKAGFEYRYRGWSNPGHTTIEVKYDGKWHYLDNFLSFYAWDKNKKTIVGQDEIIKDPDLALKAGEEGRGPENILSCGDTAKGVVTGTKSSKVLSGWGGSIKQSDGTYTMDFVLMSGQSLELDWGRDGVKKYVGYAGKNPMYPQHTCGTKEYRSHSVQGPILEHYGQRSFANGKLVFAPDFTNPECLKDVEKKENARISNGNLIPLSPNASCSITFKMGSPYIVTLAEVNVEFLSEDAKNKIEYSLDKAKWEDGANLAKGVKSSFVYYVKITSPKGMKSLTATSIVMHNRAALPFLVNGDNKVTVKAKNFKPAGKEKFTVTYAYQEATAKDGRKQFIGRDVEYGEDIVVSKDVTKAPFDFDIKVGGNTPPKMKYIKYEVK